jgi:hypothetical protein
VKTKVSLLLILSFILVSCANISNTSLPSWFIDQYDSSYSRENYICSVGSGSTKEEAGENAKIALSQIFNTSIKNSLVTFDNDTSSSMSSLGYIDTSVDDLVGVKIVNNYINNDGTYFVRVALNKKLAIDSITELITPTNSEINSLINADYVSEFEHLQNLMRARTLAISIQKYFDQLSVLEGVRVTSPLLSIEDKMTSVKQNLSVNVVVETDDELVQGQIKKALETMLLDNGISIQTDGADLVVEYIYDLAPPKDNLYQCSFSLKVQLIENSNVLLSFDKNSRAIAISEDSSKLKATEKAAEIIMGELF